MKDDENVFTIINAFKHRSIFAVFLAIFLLFGAVKGIKAQESNGSAFDGLENLVGISKAQMVDYASQGVYGTFPTDKSQIFFLYNVKTGLLLNVGGYWGTHVSLQEYGMPLSVYQDKNGWIHFQQDIDKQSASSGEGCSLEYYYDASKTAVNNGVFVDRNIYNSSTDTTVIQRGWKIVPIEGDAKETFRIYTYRRSTSGYKSSTKYDNYYLSAATSQGDVDKNCGAFLEKDKPNYSDEGSQWRIFSYEQLYNLQKSSIGFKSSLDLSFKLECPGFNRDNGTLNNWKTAVYKKGATGSFRFGWRNVIKQTRNLNHTTIQVVLHLIIHILSMEPNIRVWMITRLISVNIIAQISRIPVVQSIRWYT